MISISNLKKSISNNLIIDDLNLNICSGKITALVGKNGAGKSTLIRLIAGLLKPDEGNISFYDESSVGIMLGGDVNLYNNLTAYETILYFAKLYKISEKETEARISDLDVVLNFRQFLDKRISTLSRGMRQKVAFAISLIHNPDILLLDEPSTGLDIETSNDVIRFIKYLKTKNKTILIATHSIFEISDLSDVIVFIDRGRIYKTVNTYTFFENQTDKSELLIQTMREIIK